jgi:hypothetical protein
VFNSSRMTKISKLNRTTKGARQGVNLRYNKSICSDTYRKHFLRMRKDPHRAKGYQIALEK